MIRRSLLAAILLVAFGITALKAAPVKHDIKFTVTGLKNTVCYLGGHYGDHDFVYDTAKVDDKGDFEFSGEKDLNEGGYFIISAAKKKLFEFIVDKEQKFTMKTDTTDYIKHMKVEGSEENRLFYEFQNYTIKVHMQLDTLSRQIKNASNKEPLKRKIDSLNNIGKIYTSNFIAKHPDLFISKVFKALQDIVIPKAPILANGRPDSNFTYRYYKAHFFDNIDFSDPRMLYTPVLFPKIKEYLTRLTSPNADSVIAAADYLIAKAGKDQEMFKFLVQYIIYSYENSDVMGLDAVFVHMAKKYYTPELATWVTASQMERVQERADQLEPILIGKKAIPIALPDSNNVIQALDSIKADYTIIYFWDYDCSHCQIETPRLIKWYDSVKADIDVKVYAVQTSTTGEDKWKQYVIKHKLDWINVMDLFHTGNFRHDYDVTTTPMIYVLDKNKVIIAKKLDTYTLDKLFQHYSAQHKQ